MPNVKQVILKDPTTGQYLSPKVYGALTYEIQEGGDITPPYEDGINASQLDGHPASYFAPADHNHDDKYAKINHTHTVSQITDMPDLANAVPSGIICMWSGESTAIPSGWHLCDGSNGTPDLRDRFIVGAGSTYKVKDTGGEASHKLTTNEMPSHNHGFTGTSHSHTGSLNSATAASAGSHTHTMSENLTAASAGSHTHAISTTIVSGSRIVAHGNGATVNNAINTDDETESGGAHTHNISGTITAASAGAHTHNVSGKVTVNSATAGGTVGNTGGGQAHENRPPYFALCFIMKL